MLPTHHRPRGTLTWIDAAPLVAHCENAGFELRVALDPKDLSTFAAPTVPGAIRFPGKDNHAAEPLMGNLVHGDGD